MELKSEKLESNKLELRAINFDNVLEVNSALELVRDNLASEFSCFENNVSGNKHNDYEQYQECLIAENLVSILVFIEHQAIAHIAFSFDKTTGVSKIFAPAIDKNMLYLKSYINAAFWRTLSRLSKKQGWKEVSFSSCYANSSMSTKEFRALFTKLIPSKTNHDKIITLKDSIEIIHGASDPIQSAQEDYVEVA